LLPSGGPVGGASLSSPETKVLAEDGLQIGRVLCPSSVISGMWGEAAGTTEIGAGLKKKFMEEGIGDIALASALLTGCDCDTSS
jgi:hypothetical protein